MFIKVIIMLMKSCIYFNLYKLYFCLILPTIKWMEQATLIFVILMFDFFLSLFLAKTHCFGVINLKWLDRNTKGKKTTTKGICSKQMWNRNALSTKKVLSAMQ